MSTQYGQEVRKAIDYLGGLVSVTGLAKRWSMSRQRVLQLVASPDFPAPISVEGTATHVFLAGECEDWKHERERRFGT